MSQGERNTPYEATLTQYNALDFLIRSVIDGKIHTAIPVVVNSIERPKTNGGANYLSATPLIKPTGADGEALPPAEIPRLRWFRLQAGSAAIVIDPKPGDVGLAVFAQSDVSTLNGENEPKQVGSWRKFDMSDGFYFGGFWGKTPTTFIHLEDTGDIIITAPKTVTVNTNTATINAKAGITVNSPTSTINGNIVVKGGDVTADGISLKSHVHTGDSGGTTSAPR